jgi:hypothetical protein
MSFTATTTWDSIGFYITDPNDVGARVKLEGFDGSATSIFLEDLFGAALPNGRVYYVSIFAPDGIKSLTFTSDAGANNDGFGIDKFTVGMAVPEPGTVLLLGAGLVGLAGWQRRQA